MNLSIFQEILTPFLTVSLISTKINLFVHWYFQRQFGFCWRQSQKKSIFPPRNHYFGVFHIDHHPMHYSITKKHTLSLHVKNIDIKNYAINSATADVLGGGSGLTWKTQMHILFYFFDFLLFYFFYFFKRFLLFYILKMFLLFTFSFVFYIFTFLRVYFFLLFLLFFTLGDQPSPN